MNRYRSFILVLFLFSVSIFSSLGADLSLGKEKFETNCRSCHNLNKEEGMSIGPALSGVEKRVPNRAWILKWVNNPAGLIASKDAYALKISDQFKPVVMTGFPALKQEDIDNILAYIADAPTTTVAKADTASAQAPITNTKQEMTSSYEFLVGFAIVTFLAIILSVLRLLKLQYRAKGLNIKF